MGCCGSAGTTRAVFVVEPEHCIALFLREKHSCVLCCEEAASHGHFGTQTDHRNLNSLFGANSDQDNVGPSDVTLDVTY